MNETRAGASGWYPRLINWIMNICLFVLMFIFPLIFNDGYFDIPEVKYECYYLSILVTLGLVILLSIAHLIKTRGFHWKDYLNITRWKKLLRPTDLVLLLFWLSVLISTLQSDYLYESVWGNEGRFTGLFLISVYVVAYFMVSRIWNFKPWALQVFLVSSMIMCLIGISDYFQMDFLKVKAEALPSQRALFTSTIGNINSYTAYVALIMGFSTAMFWVEKHMLRKIWYYVCMIVSFFAIVMGCSDNAYLALGTLFGLSPLLLFQKHDGLKKYFIVLASFFSVIQCIVWINEQYADKVLGLDSLFQVIASFRGLLPFIILLWLLAGVFALTERKISNKEAVARCSLRIWKLLLVLGIAAVVFAFCDANFFGHAERYSALSNYLVFNDSWGTDRGYIWKASMRLYAKFPLMRKLFGYGPETFGILTINKIYNEMVSSTHLIFDNAHNEYLQDLVTLGAVGLITYLWFLFSAWRTMYKNREQSPYLLGLLLATLCYNVQAIVNLNQPLVAPMMWLMISIGMSTTIKKEPHPVTETADSNDEDSLPADNE